MEAFFNIRGTERSGRLRREGGIADVQFGNVHFLLTRLDTIGDSLATLRRHLNFSNVQSSWRTRATSLSTRLWRSLRSRLPTTLQLEGATFLRGECPAADPQLKVSADDRRFEIYCAYQLHRHRPNREKLRF